MGMTFSHLIYFQRHSGFVYIPIPLGLLVFLTTFKPDPWQFRFCP
jgi:hypothetical protein